MKYRPIPMTRFSCFLLGIMLSYGALAQLPNGSIAPDFTATDINGVEHNLYSYLDSGYSVILEFSATWCPPCFDHHQSGTLDTLHETYGMNGSNEVRVFFLEADDQTTNADLNGTGNYTVGDWVTGTAYPIIDNAGNIFNDYQNTYYPTILTICPNRILTEAGQVDVATHVSIFQEASCQPALSPNDPFLLSSTSDPFSCQGETTLSVRLMNNGLDVLNACTITAYDGTTAVGSFDWTGALDTYEVEEVTIDNVAISADTDFDIEITSPDDNASNNSVTASVVTPPESTNNVRFSLLLDAYPQEVQWALFNENDQIVEQGGPFAAGDANQEFVFNWTLDLGCYTFVIFDAYGDGLHGSWFEGSGPDGSFSLEAMEGNFAVSTLYSYAAPDEYAELTVPFEVTSTSSPPGLSCEFLFFSEYVEGFDNNKALEIYNPTSEFIDLSDYQIERYANGGTVAQDNQKVVLSGILAPQDVVVCVLDKRDPDGIEFETPVWNQLAEKADLWLNPNYDENNTMYFNGNDAMVLRQISTNTVLDVIGKVGEDPGSEGWAGLTKDHTLLRKFEVAGGDDNAIDDFLVVDRWDTIAWSEGNIASNVIFDDLGFHDCLCGVTTPWGCTDPEAFNFVPEAVFDDGSCVYFATTCDFVGDASWDELSLGLYLGQSQAEHELGVFVTGDFVMHMPAFYADDNGATYEVSSWDNLVWSGLPEGLSLSNASGQIDGNTQACLTYTGTPYQAGTFNVTVTGELMVSVFGTPISAGEFTSSFIMVIIPNADGILGCTYAHALNFNPAANVDNGSCEFGGCTDPTAPNFEPHASEDDGTCATGPDVAACIGDLNGDDTVGAADLLVLLSAFGGECE